MTTPTGHPDYQAYAQWRGPSLYFANFSLVSGSPFFEQLNVTNFASLDLYVNAFAGAGFTVQVGYFNDAGATQFTGGYKFVISQAGTTLQTCLPNLGNYVQVFISTAQAGTQTLSIGIGPNNTGATRPQYPLNTNVVEGVNVTIPASTTLTAYLPYIIEGDATVLLNPRNGAATTVLLVEEMTEANGVAGRLVDVPSMTGPVSAAFLTGTSQVRININNTDTAGHQYDYRLQATGR